MKIENGKIIEATESELFQEYLRRELDELYSFPDYLERMKGVGVKVLEESE